MNPSDITTSCPICGAERKQQTVIIKFRGSDHGHKWCGHCGASYDDNVVAIRALQITAEMIANINSREDYRKLFVETSEIGNKYGEIYMDFDWKDNASLREGVASYIISAIRTHSPAEDPDILDVGCGNGFTTEILAREFSLERIIGLDPSPMISQLEARTGVKGIRGTLNTINFDSGQFDVVVVIGNLMLHSDITATMNEVHRILKPGGIAVIDFKNIRCASRVLARWLIRCLPSLRASGFIERNFMNMRYGLARSHLPTIAPTEQFDLLEVVDKPPRLLEFANRSHWQNGLVGFTWRLLNAVDRLRAERA